MREEKDEEQRGIVLGKTGLIFPRVFASRLDEHLRVNIITIANSVMIKLITLSIIFTIAKTWTRLNSLVHKVFKNKMCTDVMQIRS